MGRKFVPSMSSLLETLYAKKCAELKIQFQEDQSLRFQERVMGQY